MITFPQKPKRFSSREFAPVPMDVCESRVREATRVLGGQMSGRNGRVPSPGKSKTNRSTVMFPTPKVRFGVGVHCHDNPDASRSYRDEIATRLSWSRSQASSYQASRRPLAVPSILRKDSACRESAQEAATARKRSDRCASIWMATEAAGAPLQAYLNGSRGLSVSSDDCSLFNVLRFHSALPFWSVNGENPDGSPRFHIAFTSPAMVARITDCETGRSIGLHRTWLTDDGRKNPLAGGHARKMKGLAKGGTVALAVPNEAGLIAVTEGIESALAFKELTGIGAQAALSTTGITNWTPPEGTKAVLIAHDDDAGGQGKRAADTLALRLTAMGLPSRHYPPGAASADYTQFNDWNDALLGKKGGDAP